MTQELLGHAQRSCDALHSVAARVVNFSVSMIVGHFENDL